MVLNIYEVDSGTLPVVLKFLTLWCGWCMQGSTCSYLDMRLFPIMKFYTTRPLPFKPWETGRFTEEVGTTNVNHALRLLYASDCWLERGTALELADGLLQFIRAYCKLAHIHVQKCQARFAMLPKLHSLHEIQFELRRQAALSRWVLNPAVETCSTDEDFVGRCALLTRSVSARTCALRSIQRYLAQINISWGWV